MDSLGQPLPNGLPQGLRRDQEPARHGARDLKAAPPENESDEAVRRGQGMGDKPRPRQAKLTTRTGAGTIGAMALPPLAAHLAAWHSSRILTSHLISPRPPRRGFFLQRKAGTQNHRGGAARRGAKVAIPTRGSSPILPNEVGDNDTGSDDAHSRNQEQ